MSVRPANAQADLSLRWAHSHFVGFVMSRLISCMVPGRAGVARHSFHWKHKAKKESDKYA